MFPTEWNVIKKETIFHLLASLQLKPDDSLQRHISLLYGQKQNLSVPQVRPVGTRGTPRQEVKADPPIKPLNLSVLHLSTLS